MFLTDEEKPAEPLLKGVTLGTLAGRGYRISEDFNGPLAHGKISR